MIVGFLCLKMIHLFLRTAYVLLKNSNFLSTKTCKLDCVNSFSRSCNIKFCQEMSVRAFSINSVSCRPYQTVTLKVILKVILHIKCLPPDAVGDAQS